MIKPIAKLWCKAFGHLRGKRGDTYKTDAGTFVNTKCPRCKRERTYKISNEPAPPLLDSYIKEMAKLQANSLNRMVNKYE